MSPSNMEMKPRPHHAVPADRDPLLAEMREELNAVMATLNLLHHPVYPGNPDEVRALEQRVAEIKEAMRLRRRALQDADA